MYSSMIWIAFLLIGAVNGDSTEIALSSAIQPHPNDNGTVFDFGANMTMNANGTAMLIGANMTRNAMANDSAMVIGVNMTRYANDTAMLTPANMTRNAMANDTEIVFDANGTKWTEHDTKMLFVAPLMSNDSILVQHANGTLFASLSNGTVSFVNGTQIVHDLNGTQFTPNVNGTDIVYYANDSTMLIGANMTGYANGSSIPPTGYANGSSIPPTGYANGSSIPPRPNNKGTVFDFGANDTAMLIGANMTRYANGSVIVYGANMSRYNNFSANEFVVLHEVQDDDVMSHFVANWTWFMPYVLIGNVLLCLGAAAIIKKHKNGAYKSIENESETKVLLSYV